MLAATQEVSEGGRAVAQLNDILRERGVRDAVFIYAPLEFTELNVL